MIIRDDLVHGVPSVRQAVGSEQVLGGAAHVGVTRNNATVRRHRARKALVGHCGTASVLACQDGSCEDGPAS